MSPGSAQSAKAGGALRGPSAETLQRRPTVKIARIETFLVRPDARNYVFVRVHTDEGLYGVGEAYSAGPDDATVAVINDFETWLIGRDPLDIEFLWQLMYNATRF